MLDILNQLAEIPYRYMMTIPFALPFIWAGAIIGHSFIATPAKFKAKSLEKPVALDVGRATFTVFFFFEVLCLGAITATMVIAEVGAYLWVLFVISALCLFLQRYYLRPILFNRVEDILNNRPLPKSFHHTFYSILEAVKFFTLIGLGSLLIRF